MFIFLIVSDDCQELLYHRTSGMSKAQQEVRPKHHVLDTYDMLPKIDLELCNFPSLSIHCLQLSPQSMTSFLLRPNELRSKLWVRHPNECHYADSPVGFKVQLGKLGFDGVEHFQYVTAPKYSLDLLGSLQEQSIT